MKMSRVSRDKIFERANSGGYNETAQCVASSIHDISFG